MIEQESKSLPVTVRGMAFSLPLFTLFYTQTGVEYSGIPPQFAEFSLGVRMVWKKVEEVNTG